MNLILLSAIAFFSYTILLLFIHQVCYKKYRNKCHLGEKTILITGGSTGIGAGACKEFIKKGAKVIITGRNVKNVKKLIKSLITELKFYNYIQGELKNAEVEKRIKSLENGKWIDSGINFYSEYLHYRSIDQNDFESCRRFTSWVTKNFKSLDILLNNAGATIHKQRLSKQDIEATMAINHFSHVVIVNDLLTLLEKTKGSRIINTSSDLHAKNPLTGDPVLRTDDILGEKLPYDPMKFYARSKLANVLFTNSLNKFLKKKKLDVATYSFHPGVVRTELTREAPSFIQGIARMIGLFLRSPYEGCQTAVYLVCEESQKLKQGEYYANNEIGKMNPNARDEKYCDQFWNESIKLVEDKIGGKLSFLEKQ